MRIRSIKPEFWRSDDIAALSWDDRLLFIGLWSYVDDNGVGRDNVAIVTAELFALDGGLTEASVRVQAGLDRLHTAGLIDRYTVDGKTYLHIRTWDKHQKINRPSPGRFPLPEANSTPIHDALTEPSVSPPSILRAGTEEQGNRGTGDSDYVGELVPADSTQTLVAEWIDHCKTRPPGRVIGQASKEVKAMLDEGIPYDDVRSGLAQWARKGQHPSTIPSFVNAAANATTTTQPGRPGDIDWDAAFARAAQRDQEIA